MAKWNVHIIDRRSGFSVRRFQITAADWMEAEWIAHRNIGNRFDAEVTKVTNPYNELFR